MHVALIQFTGSDDPGDNRDRLRSFVQQAAGAGAQFVATPEVCNCISTSRRHQSETLVAEGADQTLAMAQEEAAKWGITVLLGSLALKAERDPRFVNRSVLVGPDGQIKARYDKIHMFDVTLSETERYHESAAFRPGHDAVLCDIDTDWRLGMSICYDLRFPALYTVLAEAGANVITVPSAFTRPTGAAHWAVLLRARAIETGCYILAPAQCGVHPTHRGKPRSTYGHSMIIDPWGRVLDQAFEEQGIVHATLDPALPSACRAKIPSLSHRQKIQAATHAS